MKDKVVTKVIKK